MLHTLAYWKWEIAAIASCAALLATIIVLLAVYNQHPIFRWHNVTLNAIVSILSTASKAALLYAIAECIGQWKWILYSRKSRPLLDVEKIDAASRGPLGSSKILVPSSKVSLLRIGAAITILALAIDPFTQQLIQFEQHQKFTSNSDTTVTRAQRYSKGVRSNIDIVRITSPNVIVDTDFTIQSAVLFGLAEQYSTVAKQTQFNCPSGNCNWTSFNSLAVCSTCHDLKDQMIRYDAGDWMYVILGELMGFNYADQYNFNGTTFELPNGLLLNNENGPFSKNDFHPTYMTTYGTGNATKTTTFKDNDSLIWAMSILRVPPSTNSSTAIWPNIEMEAEECALYYCVKQYDSVVKNGTLVEAEQPIYAPRDPTSFQLTSDPDFYTVAGVAVNSPTTENLEFNNITSGPVRTDLRFGDGYNVSQSAVNSISAYFQDQFKIPTDVNASYVDRQGNKPQLNSTQTANLVTLNGWYQNNYFYPRSLQAIYQSTDLNATFASLAKSMSNAIRSGADNSTLKMGMNGETQTIYQVQWPWVALHAVLLLAGVVFLTLTIHETEQSGAPIWKSHSLAPFLCSMDVANLFADVTSIEIMEQKASQHFVQLYSSSDAKDQDTGS